MNGHLAKPYDIPAIMETLKKQPLVLYLTPVRKNITVDVSAMAGLQEKAEREAACLLSAEWIAVDDVAVTEGQD